MDVHVDSLVLEVTNFKEELEDPKKISFTFIVTSEDYYDVTTVLYKNNLFVMVPNEDIAFHATITNYATSITNLYVEGEEGEFYLELTETDSVQNSEK